MNTSRGLAALCMVSLLVFAAGCSDDDDITVPSADLNAGVVAASLSEAIPAAVELPIVVVDLLGPLIPAPLTRGLTCAGEVQGVCDTGTLTCTPTANPLNFDLAFASCSVDMVVINGDAFLAGTTGGAAVTFQTGFTADGDPLTGTITITITGANSYSANFSTVGLTVDGASVTVDQGPLAIDLVSQLVNGAIMVDVAASPFPEFLSTVTITDNSILAVATDNSTDPPTQYNCTGTLAYNGDISANLFCPDPDPL